MSCFERLINLPDDMFDVFETATLRRSLGSLVGHLTQPERAALEWKGMVCRQLGLTVLVDDDTKAVTLGCEIHGITLFHPDQFS